MRWQNYMCADCGSVLQFLSVYLHNFTILLIEKPRSHDRFNVTPLGGLSGIVTPIGKVDTGIGGCAGQWELENLTRIVNLYQHTDENWENSARMLPHI